MTEGEDLMALVFGGASIEKTTVVTSTESHSNVVVERHITVTHTESTLDSHHESHEETKAITINGHVEINNGQVERHAEITKAVHTEEHHGGEVTSATTVVATHLEGAHHDGELEGLHIDRVVVHADEHHHEAPAEQIQERSLSRLSNGTDTTSIQNGEYHLHEDAYKNDEQTERDHIPFRTAQQDALIAQFKQLHPHEPSEHDGSRRGTYIEEMTIADDEHPDPIDIDREHEAERLLVEIGRAEELKKALSQSEHERNIREEEEDDSDDEGTVTITTHTVYAFDNPSQVVRVDSIPRTKKRDSIDLYHMDQRLHQILPREQESLHEEDVGFESAEFVEKKEHELEQKIVEAAIVAHEINEIEHKIVEAAVEKMTDNSSSIHVVTPVVSPMSESVFMSPVSPLPGNEAHHVIDNHFNFLPSDNDSRTSSLNPRISGPRIRDTIKAVEIHDDDHYDHPVPPPVPPPLNIHQHDERHDSITSARGQVHVETLVIGRRPTTDSVRSSVPASPVPSVRSEFKDDSYSIGGGVRLSSKHFESVGSYSRASTPSGPPPPIPLWDLVKDDEISLRENVVDSSSVSTVNVNLHRSAPQENLNDSKQTLIHVGSAVLTSTTPSVLPQESFHGSKQSINHHHHHSHHGSKHSLANHHQSSYYGSKHSLRNEAAHGDLYKSNPSISECNSACRSRNTTITMIEDSGRSRGSTLTEANANGFVANGHVEHIHHHEHPILETIIKERIIERVEDALAHPEEHPILDHIIQERIAEHHHHHEDHHHHHHEEHHHHHEEARVEVAFENQKAVSALMAQFGGGQKKAYTKEEAEIRRREAEAEAAIIRAAELRAAELRAAEEAARIEALRIAREAEALKVAAVTTAVVHHHNQHHHGHSRTNSVLSAVPAPRHRDSISSVRTTRSVAATRAAANRDPFATLPRPPPQHYHVPGYTRNPMTSPSLVKKNNLYQDANKFSSVRVVRNVRGFIKDGHIQEWGQKDFVPPRSPLSPTLAVWHEEDSRRSSVVSNDGQSLIGIGQGATVKQPEQHSNDSHHHHHHHHEQRPHLTPLVERRREYEEVAAVTGVIHPKTPNGIPPMVNLLA